MSRPQELEFPYEEWLHTPPPEPDVPIDVAPLRQVFDEYGTEPSDNIFETGDMLLAIAAALPAARRNPNFAGPYGHLSVMIGHGIHHRHLAGYRHLPEFHQGDELEHVAGGFAKKYADAVEAMARYHEAQTTAERVEIYDSIPHNWRTHMFAEVSDHTVPAGPDPRLEAAPPPAQLWDGYLKHVVAHDLGENMFEHDVSDVYIDPEYGDYFGPVNSCIRMSSMELGPHLMGANDRNRHTIQQTMPAVAYSIAVMRERIAVPNMWRFRDAGSEEEHETLAATMDERSVRYGSVALRYANLTLGAYNAFIKGGLSWEVFRRRQ